MTRTLIASAAVALAALASLTFSASGAAAAAECRRFVPAAGMTIEVPCKGEGIVTAAVERSEPVTKVEKAKKPAITRVSDQQECRRYVPAAGMTIKVPCEGEQRASSADEPAAEPAAETRTVNDGRTPKAPSGKRAKGSDKWVCLEILERATAGAATAEDIATLRRECGA